MKIDGYRGKGLNIEVRPGFLSLIYFLFPNSVDFFFGISRLRITETDKQMIRPRSSMGV